MGGLRIRNHPRGFTGTVCLSSPVLTSNLRMWANSPAHRVSIGWPTWLCFVKFELTAVSLPGDSSAGAALDFLALPAVQRAQVHASIFRLSSRQSPCRETPPLGRRISAGYACSLCSRGTSPAPCQHKTEATSRSAVRERSVPRWRQRKRNKPNGRRPG